jgi:Ca-activated chloride channel family protein
MWVAVLALCACRSGERGAQEGAGPWAVTPESVQGEVLRCARDGQSCAALDQGVSLAAAVVKTGQGGSATLRADAATLVRLDESTELALGEGGPVVRLAVGRMVIERGPAESPPPLVVDLAGSRAELGAGTTVAAEARAADRILATVHRGRLAFGPHTVRSGETVHLVRGREPDVRGAWDGRLGPVMCLEPETAPGRAEVRGLGRMTARVPGQEQVVGGVGLVRHDVRVVIRDGYARTEIEEEFKNETDRVLEGRYVFPVPPDASISRLALWVGEELVEGELVESKRAARIFKGIVDDTVRPRDPALLEWLMGGEVSLKIFPIEPKKSRKVLLAYDQALERDGDRYRYVYPVSQGRERATTIERFTFHVQASDARAPLVDPRTPGHAMTVRTDDAATTLEWQAAPFAPRRDFEVTFARKGADTVEAAAELSTYEAAAGAAASPALERIAACKAGACPPPGGDGYFALRVRAELPPDAPPPALRRLDRALVLDTSYSQSAETLSGQIEIAKTLLRHMDPHERFAVLACDSGCEAHPAGGLAAATAAEIAAAEKWLDAREIRGATDIAGALLAGAARLEGSDAPQLVYLGDGSASAGPLAVDAIAGRVAPAFDKHPVDLRLLAAGRNLDMLALEALAQRLGGNLDRVSRAGEPLGERAQAMALALRRPLVRGATLSLPRAFERQHPRTLPSLRLGQEVLVVGRLTAREEGEVTLTGMLDGKPYRLAKAVRWDEQARRQNPLVPNLWASAQIAALETSETPEARKEVIALSRQYRVMSRHTSYLVLENDAMFAMFGIPRTVPSGREPSAGEGEAAAVARELSRLDIKSLGTLGAAPTAAAAPAPAPMAPGRAADISEGAGPSVGRTLEPQGQAQVGGGGVSGGSVANAASVVARMRGRFRNCYQHGLTMDPNMQGQVTLVAKVGANGDVLSVGGGSGGALARIVPCLRAVVSDAKFAPPEGGSAVVSIPITFVRMEGAPPSQVPPPWVPPSLMPAPPPTIEVRHQPGSDGWMEHGEKRVERATKDLAAEPTSRRRHEEMVRALILAGRFEPALEAAERFTELDPDLDRARELLAHAAALNGRRELALAAVASRVELDPRSANGQIRAARAYAAAGDAVRSCAHWTAVEALDPKNEEARDEAARCVAGRAVSGADRKKIHTAFEASLECSAGDACPLVAVLAPDGRVVSPWTPSEAPASRLSVALGRAPGGTYRTLLIGPTAGAAKLRVTASGNARTFELGEVKTRTAAITEILHVGVF